MSSTLPDQSTLPDRLAINPKSPHFNEALLARGIGIRFNGAEKTNVEEYCVSEGWIRVAVGKTVGRDGSPMTMKMQGKVEPYLRDQPAEETTSA
ncbi:DUF3297 family protein [Lichenicola cladoniae]|uniref:DUF3297 family protein n=1 Tax=Lichenicola cladoniae TaxID=1484109 RepID=A0A6M8HHT8_9PROT|nr:DUF3297 family protein [Lichenicola cladoniae]NPD68595.1 DUF3297 family protein [Acetobacteraceae bacterium]QKE88929.1 DUF3297 family protein [Lichenicola cladoniae]